LAKTYFLIEFYEFIDKCYASMYLRHLSDKDINIFLTKAAKLQASQENIIWNLLDWLQDLHEAFSLQLTDILPPH
jgi:hypothetical protein